MDQIKAYLKKSMGIDIKLRRWEGADVLPLYLKAAARYGLATIYGGSFLLVQPIEDGLPAIKRLYGQLIQRTEMPVAVCVPTVDARQRKTLVAQGIPFICTGRQVFLPFLGMACTEWGRTAQKTVSEKLSFRAQQAAIWGALRTAPYTLEELGEATGMSPARASEASRELEDRKLVLRKKSGRTFHVVPMGLDELLRDHMGSLSTPVYRSMYVRQDSFVGGLPLAGETALATRTMLNESGIAERAAYRSVISRLKKREIIAGELPDEQTLLVQVWKYSPLFAGFKEIDSVSLALSFCDSADERILGELHALFGEEYRWEEAR